MATMEGSANTKINPHTMDKDYDLISVLYHSLQAVETCAQYEQDAKSEGSQEVAEFMREVQKQNQNLARRAKELLLKQEQV